MKAVLVLLLALSVRESFPSHAMSNGASTITYFMLTLESKESLKKRVAMYKILMFLSVSSYTVHAMEDAESALRQDLEEQFPAKFGVCGLVERTETLTRVPLWPKSIKKIDAAYADVNVYLVIASLDRVREIIDNKTSHIRGPYIEVARKGWMTHLLKHATRNNDFAMLILRRFPLYTHALGAGELVLNDAPPTPLE